MSEVSRVAINLQFTTAPKISEADTGVDYLWGRIAIASAAFLAIVVLLSWLLYNHLTAEDSTATVDAPVILQSEQVTPSNSQATQSDATPSQPEPESDLGVDDQIIFEEIAVNDAEDETLFEEVTIDETVEEELVEKELIEENSSTENVSKETSAKETIKSTARTNNTIHEDNTTQLSITPKQLAKITLLAPTVISAQLGTKVEKRSITEPLSSTLVIPQNQVLKVHFMTEYQGLKNQWVYHDWYRNNTRVVRIKVRPQSNKMLAFSSKNIDTSMTGAWQVKVVNDNNILLALGEFNVLAAQ